MMPLLRLPLLSGIAFVAVIIVGTTLRPSGATIVDAPTFQDLGTITDKCWIFMHLQKSGGSTIKGILRDSWSPRYAVYDSGNWKEGEQFLGRFGKVLAGGRQWNVVTGGYPEALRRSLAADVRCDWFTLFRHPVSRMVSAYYYCKQTPKDKACASEVVNANEVDLVAFAKHWGNFAMRQLSLSLVSADDVMEFSRSDKAREMLPASVRKVSNLPGWYLLKMYLDDRASSSKYGHAQNIPDVAMYEMMNPVQDLLRDKYAAVGILEEFNTTLSLFNAALTMPGLDWHHQFVDEGIVRVVDSRYSEEKEVVLADAWTNWDIRKYMQLDIVLYEHAVDVFHQQSQKYGV